MMKVLSLLVLTIGAVDCLNLGSSSFTPGFKCSAPASSPQMTMKIFDWKRRDADESELTDIDRPWTLTTLKPAPGSVHRKKRKGRGIAAGQGASCGFGMRGQKSRSGRPTRAGFEGGQNPLYRRLPKFVGKPMGPGHKRKLYNIIKLEELNGEPEGDVVRYETLLAKGKITKSKYPIHKVVVGKGEYNGGPITVQANAFTASAREAIEGQGGKCEILSRTTGQVLVEAN